MPCWFVVKRRQEAVWKLSPNQARSAWDSLFFIWEILNKTIKKLGIVIFRCARNLLFWRNSERARSLPTVEMTALFFAMEFWFRLCQVG